MKRVPEDANQILAEFLDEELKRRGYKPLEFQPEAVVEEMERYCREALWEDASPGIAARNAVTLHMWDLLYWDEPDWEAKAG